MHIEASTILAEAGFPHQKCPWCHSIAMEYTGNTSSGLFRVDCETCGSRHVRMSRQEALVWAAKRFAAAAELEQGIRTEHLFSELYHLWTTRNWESAKDAAWYMTREGSDDDAEHELPF